MAKAKTQTEWRDRYVETITVRADEIAAHPRNPKVHGEFQKEALSGLLADVGKIDSLKAYRDASGKLICWDGHCRRDLKPDEMWRVDVYDLQESEIPLVLASFDPIGWQASQSAVKLNDLLRDVSTGQAAVMEMLSKEAERCGAVVAEASSGNDEPVSGEPSERGAEEGEPEEEPFRGVFALQESVIFPTSNRWGIPDLLPRMCSEQVPSEVFGRQEIEDGSKMLFVHQTAKFPPEARGGVLAFYVDDWRFESVWSDAVMFAEDALAFGWGSLVSPDFSVWRDDPAAIQLWNIYRSRWVARYWQEAGLKVIPSLNWSDERSYDFAHSGIPKDCPVVSVQCRTTRSRLGKEYFVSGLSNAIEQLTPQNVLIYGGSDHQGWLADALPEGPVYHWLESWTSIRRKRVFQQENSDEEN